MRAMLLLLTLFLCACSVGSTQTKAPTASGPVTRQQAIDASVKSVSSSRPEISGALITPSNVRAQQMTLREALRHRPRDLSPVAGYGLQMSVWYVTMDGLWANEVQAPGVSATQTPLHHAAVILDAQSGMEIESWMMP